ncbi:unnamed protein product [Pleuronectes platessa]|uniref:Uncharacterized protein n=1 Tax=Pleuronectes platessa TaxID=8262 RepID=A0A9N7THM4_PLEPL|nr:unnamed protein product [Pleuronectes platessa]
MSSSPGNLSTLCCQHVEQLEEGSSKCVRPSPGSEGQQRPDLSQDALRIEEVMALFCCQATATRVGRADYADRGKTSMVQSIWSLVLVFRFYPAHSGGGLLGPVVLNGLALPKVQMILKFNYSLGSVKAGGTGLKVRLWPGEWNEESQSCVPVRGGGAARSFKDGDKAVCVQRQDTQRKRTAEEKGEGEESVLAVRQLIKSNVSITLKCVSHSVVEVDKMITMQDDEVMKLPTASRLIRVKNKEADPVEVWEMYLRSDGNNRTFYN